MLQAIFCQFRDAVPSSFSVWGALKLSSPLLCPSGWSRSHSSQTARQKREGFSLSQAQTLGVKNPALLLSTAPTWVNSELFLRKQNEAEKQKRSAGTAGSVGTSAASFPTSFSFTISSARCFSNSTLAAGHRGGVDLGKGRAWWTTRATGADAAMQPCALSHLNSPRAPSCPPLWLGPKFPTDSARTQPYICDCPEIPQGCSSKTTTAFSHSHQGGNFCFHSM